jgi:hypothetical protein
MDISVIVAGVIVALVLWLWHERSQRRSAEALNDNAKTKEQVDNVQKEVVKNEAEIKVEEEKREELKKKLEDEKSKDPSKDEILDFFNKEDK